MELVKGKGNVHYEAEVLLRLNSALEVDAVSLGLDLTLRDLQATIKKNGHPWEISKVHMHPLSPLVIMLFVLQGWHDVQRAWLTVLVVAVKFARAPDMGVCASWQMYSGTPLTISCWHLERRG